MLHQANVEVHFSFLLSLQFSLPLSQSLLIFEFYNLLKTAASGFSN